MLGLGCKSQKDAQAPLLRGQTRNCPVVILCMGRSQELDMGLPVVFCARGKSPKLHKRLPCGVMCRETLSDLHKEVSWGVSCLGKSPSGLLPMTRWPLPGDPHIETGPFQKQSVTTSLTYAWAGLQVSKRCTSTVTQGSNA